MRCHSADQRPDKPSIEALLNRSFSRIAWFDRNQEANRVYFQTHLTLSAQAARNNEVKSCTIT